MPGTFIYPNGQGAGWEDNGGYWKFFGNWEDWGFVGYDTTASGSGPVVPRRLGP